MPLEKIACFAKDYLQSFKNLPNSTPTLLRLVVQKWIPPVSDIVKAKFDGAWLPESCEAGTGVVICNSESEVMTAMLEKITKPPSVEVLELLAARHVAMFTMEVGFHWGDAAYVVFTNFWYGTFFRWSYFKRHSLSLANSFQSLSFSHVVKQGNVVAHALA